MWCPTRVLQPHFPRPQHRLPHCPRSWGSLEVRTAQSSPAPICRQTSQVAMDPSIGTSAVGWATRKETAVPKACVVGAPGCQCGLLWIGCIAWPVSVAQFYAHWMVGNLTWPQVLVVLSFSFRVTWGCAQPQVASHQGQPPLSLFCPLQAARTGASGPVVTSWMERFDPTLHHFLTENTRWRPPHVGVCGGVCV